jgi:hypothetical protein
MQSQKGPLAGPGFGGRPGSSAARYRPVWPTCVSLASYFRSAAINGHHQIGPVHLLWAQKATPAASFDEFVGGPADY